MAAGKLLLSLFFVWVVCLTSTVHSQALPNPCLGVEYNRFVPDPTSCERYFLCRHNQPISGSCENGFHFDYDTQMCLPPAQANCQVVTEAPTTTPSGPIENWICIGRQHNSFCADPRSCGSYFLCVNGIGRPGDCPFRRWFHPLFHFCTNPGGFCRPRENQCDNGVNGQGQNCEVTTTTTTPDPPTPTTTTTTTTTPTTPTTTTEVSTTSTTPSGPIELWVCIGFPNNSFRNHPHRCGSYFLCRNFIGVSGDCPRRSWFHPEFRICTNPGQWCRPQVECDNGIDAEGRNCEGDRDTTSTTTTTTTTPTTTVSTTPSTTPDPSTPLELWVCIGRPNNSFRSHPHRCGSFFLCVNNHGFVGVCPRNFWFHPSAEVCTTPGNWCTPEETCDNGVGTNCPDSKESKESKESNESKDSKEEDCDSDSNSSSSSESNDSRCKSGEDNGGERPLCAGVRDLDVIPNPTDCTSFFLCMFETGLPVQCPDGLWFNPNTRVCTTPGDFCTAVTTVDPIITPEHGG